MESNFVYHLLNNILIIGKSRILTRTKNTKTVLDFRTFNKNT